MLKLTNIDYQMVIEMAEGDKEFETELLDAIKSSVKDLRLKYIDGINTKNEEVIMQARHKIKPTLSLFCLTRISNIIDDGKAVLCAKNFDGPAVEKHKAEFLEAVDDLLDELSSL